MPFWVDVPRRVSAATFLRVWLLLLLRSPGIAA
jgi:hypothetical protein